VAITGPTSAISSSFNGAGEIELNEVTFKCGSDDSLRIAVLEGGNEIHHVDVSMEKIKEEADWSILEAVDFEVRIQFLISSPLPSDFIDTTFDLIGGPKAWYFKADELYALFKTIAQQLKLPSQLGVTSEQVVERVSKLVDMATEAVVKKFSPLSTQDEIKVLQKIDELLTLQCTALDAMVDSSRLHLIAALRKLKASLEESLRKQIEYVEHTVESTREMKNKAIENVTTSVNTLTTSTKASVDGAKGQVDTYKTYVKEQVDSVKGNVTRKVSSLSEESKEWATAFLAARVVQGKGALDSAQPYVVQAVGATKPYASRVVTAAQPYVNMAIPYVEKAKTMAEGNQYVGQYVAPVLSTANQVLDEAKNYMGLKAAAEAVPVPAAVATN
jgi:hypothetical protein